MNELMIWNPDPVIFSIGGFNLKYYSLCWALAFALCYVVMRRIFRKEQLKDEAVDSLLIYVFIGTFIGARLGHCLFYDTHYYLTHPVEMILPVMHDSDGWHIVGYAGLASHGGAIGIVAALWLYSRRYGHPIWDLLDKLGVVAPLGGAFIRIGNFFNSEIIGSPTDVPWAVTFPRADLLPRHPAQLYEAAGYMLIFAVTYYMYTRRREKVNTGFVFALSILLIFALRFFVEYVKEVQEPFEVAMRGAVGLDMGQLLSLPFIITGAVLITVFGRQHAAISKKH